jgi:UPF0271 protein
VRRLRVERAGTRTTVEDLGRRNVARFGVPPGGAFDPLAMVTANRAVGNPDGAAGLEATLDGPTLRNDGDEPLDLAVVGALLLGPGGADVEASALATIHPGEVARVASPLPGSRAWLAVAGGIDVPLVLGSRSTCLAGGFGGYRGRALAAGDILPIGPASPGSGSCSSPPGPTRAPAGPALLRLLPGPDPGRWPSDPIPVLESTLWEVERDSDRTGVRLRPLDPTVVGLRLDRPAGIPPEGTVLGALQVLPEGSAILLGPDRPVTGGYAMAAVLARADLGMLARLRPGDRVRFAGIDRDAARGGFPSVAPGDCPGAQGAGACIDLNADVGEGFPEDDLLPLLTSASVSCGAHGGDEATVRRTIALAKAHGLAIGAHPGFPDRRGFGRRVTTRDPVEIREFLARQIGFLVSSCAEAGTEVAYVKPHGALYNLASAEPDLAQLIRETVDRVLPGRPVVLAAGSPGLAALGAGPHRSIAEAFVDRGYRADGSLVPRSEPGARIDDPDEAARRAVSLALEGRVASVDGRALHLSPATLCLHGDTPGATAIARAVQLALRRAGIALSAFAEVVRDRPPGR